MMLRSLLSRGTRATNGFRFVQFNPQRGMHSRNKKAMEFIAKGWNALKEVDRVIDYCEHEDQRLIPMLKTAKENFELAMEVDNYNTHARYWLSKLHLKYHVLGACKAIGAALLVEAAEMGNKDALYELGCKLRVDNDYVQSDQQAFNCIEKAGDQMHPGALYLLGTVYLSGDCVQKDLESALWCFHKASERDYFLKSVLLRSDYRDFLECHALFLCQSHNQYTGLSCLIDLPETRLMIFLQGHAGAAIACGSLLLRGVDVPESLVRLDLKKKSWIRNGKSKEVVGINPVEMARNQFERAARGGCDLGFRWLKRLEEEEKRLMSS